MESIIEKSPKFMSIDQDEVTGPLQRVLSDGLILGYGSEADTSPQQTGEAGSKKRRGKGRLSLSRTKHIKMDVSLH